ncbi:hypothetical protein Hanom_Chr07g00677611 [Helianthus anomalus]
MSSSLLTSPPMFIRPATSSIHVCCLFFLYSHFLKSIKKITSNGFYLFFNKVDYLTIIVEPIRAVDLICAFVFNSEASVWKQRFCGVVWRNRSLTKRLMVVKALQQKGFVLIKMQGEFSCWN